jgi:hypothetical protein
MYAISTTLLARIARLLSELAVVGEREAYAPLMHRLVGLFVLAAIATLDSRRAEA